MKVFIVLEVENTTFNQEILGIYADKQKALEYLEDKKFCCAYHDYVIKEGEVIE